MWKATFPWHVEDMDFYAINMIHYGEPKTWYCVPPKYGHLLERVAKKLFPQYASFCTSFLRHKIALISPEVLEKHGVPVIKMLHEARSIIVVFPYAYHSGFNHGYNIAESTNFATERWIEYGKRHRPCDCMTRTVKVDMTAFVKRFQKDRLDKWMDGTDIAPHPEDPEEVREEIFERASDPKKYAKKMETKFYKPPVLLKYETRNGDLLLADPIRKEILKRTSDWDDEEEERYQAWRAGMEDLVCADIYRHIELSHVEVKVDPITRQCLDYNALSFLRARLGKPHIKSFKSLLECGEMFKFDMRMVHKSEIREKEVKVDPIKAAIKAEAATADEEDEEDEDEGSARNSARPKPKSRVVKPPAPKVDVRADDTEDSDADSYYSDEGDYGDESSGDSSTTDISSASDYEDPDFGKPQYKRKRKRLTKKEKKMAKRRMKHFDRRTNTEITELSKNVQSMVVVMEAIRRGKPVQPCTEDKENVPEKSEAAAATAERVGDGAIKTETPADAASSETQTPNGSQDSTSTGAPLSIAPAAIPQPSNDESSIPSAEEAKPSLPEDPNQVQESKGPCPFNYSQLYRQRIVPTSLTPEQFAVVSPIFYGLKIVEKKVSRPLCGDCGENSKLRFISLLSPSLPSLCLHLLGLKFKLLRVDNVV